jgi:nicotinate dehydrogenase subunit A
MPLLYALRNDIGLNNPRFGCGLAQCGACTVHLDGELIRSCITPISAVGKRKVATLAGPGHLTSRIRCRPAERTNIQPIKLP